MRCSFLALTALCLACKGDPDATPWCSLRRDDAPLDASVARTYWRDLKPLVDARIDALRRVVTERTMPPYHAARCCTTYRFDEALTDVERDTFLTWLAQGAPEGDPAAAPATPPRPVGGLSRVDLTLRMPEAYLPEPPPGSTDDNRCFVLPWPVDRAMFITGMDVVPGARGVVHHLVVGALAGGDADIAEARDRADPLPGFSCNDGFGGIRNVQLLGGSLLGSDFPDGLGHRIEPGGRILLNIHYSTAHHDAVRDQTAVRLRLDPQAREFNTLSVANPAWLVGDALRIPAGAPDAVFFYQNRPTVSTGGSRVWLLNATAHMHEFATRVRMMIIRADGRRECLLEIPRWEFGWERPYWFDAPKALDPDDELYIECHFDNSAANQPRPGSAPRDIAWGGNNQDMCAGFVAFTAEAP